MFSTLFVVLPIFGLIFMGWLVRQIGILSAYATTELNRFVVYLALPALLFDLVVHARWLDIWQPSFIVVFGLSVALIFCLTVAFRWRPPRHLADATIDGLNAGYANTGFIGFPLAFAAFGREAMAPTLVATIITACVLFAVAIALIEVGLQSEKRALHLVRKVGRSLLGNPLLTAPTLGVLVQFSGLNLPGTVDSFLKLLGGAASPCALVALGLFLAEKRETVTREFGTVALLVSLKLLLQPAIAWVLARAFALSPPMAHAAILMAALPTGTGSFMLAEFYKREANVTSDVVLISTLVSVLTLTAYIAMAS